MPDPRDVLRERRRPSAGDTPTWAGPRITDQARREIRDQTLYGKRDCVNCGEEFSPDYNELACEPCREALVEAYDQKILQLMPTAMLPSRDEMYAMLRGTDAPGQIIVSS